MVCGSTLLIKHFRIRHLNVWFVVDIKYYASCTTLRDHDVFFRARHEKLVIYLKFLTKCFFRLFFYCVFQVQKILSIICDDRICLTFLSGDVFHDNVVLNCTCLYCSFLIGLLDHQFSYKIYFHFAMYIYIYILNSRLVIDFLISLIICFVLFCFVLFC